MYIHINDVNEAPTLSALDTLSVYENDNSTSLLQELSLFAEDEDYDDSLTYSFTTATEASYGDKFSVNSRSGNLYLKRALNYEEEQRYVLYLKATDSEGLSSTTQPQSINVKDVNEAPTCVLYQVRSL